MLVFNEIRWGLFEPITNATFNGGKIDDNIWNSIVIPEENPFEDKKRYFSLPFKKMDMDYLRMAYLCDQRQYTLRRLLSTISEIYKNPDSHRLSDNPQLLSFNYIEEYNIYYINVY